MTKFSRGIPISQEMLDDCVIEPSLMQMVFQRTFTNGCLDKREARMFNEVLAEQINQSNQAHAVNYMTLVLALIEKGVISADEIEKARSQATHFVEQEWARKREEHESLNGDPHADLEAKR